MRFFESAADWADRKAVDIKFTRDEFDRWFAILYFRDARGPFTATVNAIQPRKKSHTYRDGERNINPAEMDDEFDAHVSRMMDAACVNARKSRMPKHVMARKAA